MSRPLLSRTLLGAPGLMALGLGLLTLASATSAPTLTLAQQAVKAQVIVRATLGTPASVQENGQNWTVYPITVAETVVGDAQGLPKYKNQPSVWVLSGIQDGPQLPSGEAMLLLYTSRFDSPLVGFTQGVYGVSAGAGGKVVNGLPEGTPGVIKAPPPAPPAPTPAPAAPAAPAGTDAPPAPPADATPGTDPAAPAPTVPDPQTDSPATPDSAAPITSDSATADAAAPATDAPALPTDTAALPAETPPAETPPAADAAPAPPLPADTAVPPAPDAPATPDAAPPAPDAPPATDAPATPTPAPAAPAAPASNALQPGQLTLDAFRKAVLDARAQGGK
ncbi:hypothetical protein [Deinococcus sp.]|uniref:hypothetical protein n=1 Tax=Deinococcus sp. TaxID=47478 RepID=UPI003B5972D6